MYLSQWLTIISLVLLFSLLLLLFLKGLKGQKMQRKSKQDQKNDRAFEETFTRLRQETEVKRHDIKRTFQQQPPNVKNNRSTHETIYYPSLQTEDYITNQSQEETNDGSHAADQ